MKGKGERAAPLKVVFVCQAVDEDDPVLPTTVRWIEALARQQNVESVSVLSLRTGRYRLPANVEVKRFGRSNRLATSAAFYKAAVGSLRRRPDIFFIYQGGPYPALLLPFKQLRGIPIVQWKAHPVISKSMAFYARRCDDLILTSARAAFPMDLQKVRVVGQGIDTDLFRIEERPPLGDLIAVARISPVKRVDQIVKAVVEANRNFGTRYTLDIFGPTLAGDERYEEDIRTLIQSSGAEDSVSLHGPVNQDTLPALLNGYRACLNFSTGALDKTSVEAMACGLPVISTNAAITEVMPAELHSTLIVDQHSTDDQARAIHELLGAQDGEIAQLGQRLRSMVVSDHSIERLFDRIVDEIETMLGDRR